VGDHTTRKEADKLAALAAVFELHGLGLVRRQVLAGTCVAHAIFAARFCKQLENASKSKQVGHPSMVAEQTTLSDGTVINYERARQFMDYYCRRYKFGKPDVEFHLTAGKRGNSAWEAVMTVGGRRIGMGSAASKKNAQTACYLDVTQYLESCDKDLWKTFAEAAKSGRDLGMAPTVYFSMSSGLDDEIRDLCHDIRKSSLFKNRPATKISTNPTDSSNVQTRSSDVPYRPEAVLAAKSDRLLKRKQEYLENPDMEKMRSSRMLLPVYTRAAELIAHVENNEVTICMAATGSGKTTQLPQLILDEWIGRGQGAHCNIMCTQPRRIAAISVADRVAKERGETLGRGSIGYQVRFDAKLPEPNGSITFCTTGIFLKRMQSALSGGGSKLDEVTHVVVDEVHERDVDTDLLLVALKRLLADRKARNLPIKIILMSATIDPTLFQTYFPDEHGQPASIIEVPGRSFPVTKHFMDDFIPQLAENKRTAHLLRDPAVEKYLGNEIASSSNFNASRFTPQAIDSGMKDDLDLPYNLIGLTISYVLQKSDSGHVLVFLAGWEEIMATQKLLMGGTLDLNFNDSSKYSVHLLHSTIPLAEQQVIFEPPRPGVRRIILATNIAETSVTIPDVVYVVDTGKVKEQRYDPERHMSSLVSAWVGSSNLNQRAGRAGRHRSGEYFGILGRRRLEKLHAYQTVEMKRVDLSNVVMHVKALDFPGLSVEEVLAATIEPPAAVRVEAAMKDLQMVGALDHNKDLTSLGRVLLQLPVEAQMGRLVLYGSFFRCLDQALTLAAILTNRDPFVSPMHLKEESRQAKNSWSPPEFRSDALATLRAYNAWSDLQNAGEYDRAHRFCIDNFLARPTLLTIQRIKEHLLQSLYHAGVIDVSAGGSATTTPGRGRTLLVPPELNTNGDSLPLLAALIAIASQPKFAIRAGEKSYRTSQDKVCSYTAAHYTELTLPTDDIYPSL
jgi:HrpA-like RNA helicase